MEKIIELLKDIKELNKCYQIYGSLSIIKMSIRPKLTGINAISILKSHKRVGVFLRTDEIFKF